MAAEHGVVLPQFLRFTDRDGRRWRVYEFSIIAGRVLYVAPGAGSAQYKGFVPDPSDGRPRRHFMMLSRLRPDDRRTDAAALQLQLDLSDIDPRDDPTHPLNRALRLGPTINDEH